MVLPTDIQFSFIAGAYFVDMARTYINEAQQSPTQAANVHLRFCLMGALYAAVFMIPDIAVSFSAYPAWESQYWMSAAEHLAGHGYLALLAGLYVVLAISAGYYGAWLALRWLTTGKGRRIRPMYLLVLAVTMIIYLGKWPAPVRVGSVAQFRADPLSLPLIWQNQEFFHIYLILLAYNAIPIILAFFILPKWRLENKHV